MADPPSKTLALVVSAIKNLCEQKGSTSREILNYLSSVYQIPAKVARRQMQTALKRAVAYGILRKDGSHYILPTTSDTTCQEVAEQEIDLLDLSLRSGKRRHRRGCKSRRRRSRRSRRRSCKCKSKRSRRRRRSRGCKRRPRRPRKCSCGGLGRGREVRKRTRSRTPATIGQHQPKDVNEIGEMAASDYSGSTVSSLEVTQEAS